MCAIERRKWLFILKRNKTKTKYYVIKPQNQETGLFSYFNLFLPEILMAKTAGWIPVVDMQTIKTPYLDINEVGKRNAWEAYFFQPGGKSFADIDTEEVIDSNDKPYRNGPYSGRAFYEDWYGDKTFWRRFVAKEIRVQNNIIELAEAWWKHNNNALEKVLGVLCRGTDYLRLQPTGHARQPEPRQCIKKTKELMELWNCSKIYLSTEDESILRMFQAEFTDCLCFYNKEYAKDSGEGYVTQIHYDRIDDARKQGEEYLIQILLLSKCNCLLAGACGGTIGAELFTKGFEKEFIWDLGVYD